MLPLALKIAWLVLSFTGMVSCWAVFAAFSSLLGSYWWAIAYCVGIGLLEGFFCLGMIWEMEPMHMPRGFCLAQTFIMGFAHFLLAGVIAAFTIATFRFVMHPKQWPEGEKRVLLWRQMHAVPIFVFPVLGSVGQITTTIELNSVQPIFGLSCDANHPIWTRFLGYAGIPLIVCIPSMLVTGFCMSRVYKTHQHISRARSRYSLGNPLPPAASDRFTTAPSPASRQHQRRSLTPLAAAEPSPTSEVFSTNVVATMASLRTKSASDEAKTNRSRRSSTFSALAQEVRTFDSSDTASSAFPTFAPPSNAPSVADRTRDRSRDWDIASVHTASEKEQWPLDELDASHTDVEGGIELLKWQQSSERVPGGYSGKSGCGPDYDPDDPISWAKHRHSAFSQRPRRPTYCNLPPPICRIVRYQMTFNLIQLVSSISTLVYVLRGHAAPYIPHYVSLLLYAWAPVIFFASLPAVRERLCFWRS
ncbi:hypothetical protein HGRIS_000524 [Hohenbuehelia grisea]|uniref:Uncharacterized protein n=1 Tax=Hohenbuehelia grisea TaxID=104357 RepID=A0ABR3JTC0_9AGAR